MSRLLSEGSLFRRVVGHIIVAVGVLAIYLVAYWLVPAHAVGISVACATGLIVYFQRRWKPQIPTYDHQLTDLSALISLSPLRTQPVLPYSSMALDGTELQAVVSHAMLSEPSCIVECGSGVSTVMLGNVLKARKAGHLYALEEDESWYRLMRDLVSAQGLEQYVDIFHAPVEDGWYSHSVVEAVRARVKHIDLLLVDGPQTKAGQSRYGALGFFSSALDATSTVMLHDVNREEEQTILERWQAEFPVTVDRLLSAGDRQRGLAIMRVIASESGL